MERALGLPQGFLDDNKIVRIDVSDPEEYNMKMNLAELTKALDLIGMPARVLSLGGQAENSWCVDEASDGTWEVFWMERGNKIDLVRLASESDACFQLLGRLAYTQLAAGAVGRL